MKEITNYNDIPKNKPALLVFSAPWCGPCRMMAPLYEKISKDYEGSVEVLKVNIDLEETKELTAKFDIRSVPSMFILDKKTEIHKVFVGAQGEGVLKAELDKTL